MDSTQKKKRGRPRIKKVVDSDGEGVQKKTRRGRPKTKKTESDVIKIMRRNLKPSSFRLWRKRVHEKSIKHRKKFLAERKKLKKNDFL